LSRLLRLPLGPGSFHTLDAHRAHIGLNSFRNSCARPESLQMQLDEFAIPELLRNLNRNEGQFALAVWWQAGRELAAFLATRVVPTRARVFIHRRCRNGIAVAWCRIRALRLALCTNCTLSSWLSVCLCIPGRCGRKPQARKEGSTSEGCQNDLARADSNRCGRRREMNLVNVPFVPTPESQTFRKCLKRMAGTTRLELATSAVTALRE